MYSLFILYLIIQSFYYNYLEDPKYNILYEQNQTTIAKKNPDGIIIYEAGKELCSFDYKEYKIILNDIKDEFEENLSKIN